MSAAEGWVIALLVLILILNLLTYGCAVFITMQVGRALASDHHHPDWFDAKDDRVRAATEDAVFLDLATQQRRQRSSAAARVGECELRCGAACMGGTDMMVSEHCARKCAAACGTDFV